MVPNVPCYGNQYSVLWYPIWHDMVTNIPANSLSENQFSENPFSKKHIFGKPIFENLISGKNHFQKSHPFPENPFQNKHYIRWRRGLWRFAFLKKEHFIKISTILGDGAASGGSFL